MKIVLLSLGVVLIAGVLQPNVHEVFRRGVKWDGAPSHQEATEIAPRKKRAVTIKEHEIKFHERDRDGNVIVPYNISDEFYNVEVRIIEKVLEDIEKNTCIRFERRSPSSERGSPLIQFETSSSGGCSNGQIRHKVKTIEILLKDGVEKKTVRTDDILVSNVIMLGRDGCINNQTIYHEILHSLGVYHEQMRPDRDEYVTIHHDNIMKGKEKQFEKLLDDDVETHGTPYDFYSVMHYAKNEGGINGANVIETHPYFQDKIGIGQAPSELDYLGLCRLYKCKACMGW
ncbi:unnamed protein product [Nippostrongylus brasiliensis]|uniref:Metalloendopeptidase n=1 Tax=Nippostrongylus brasiliensis TaxID=27835 RepID=A0A0N4Y7N5_NIPBR|nr:unnamed protein product [Nippostrongylus brasiliensis]